jgi:hypothetical protein
MRSTILIAALFIVPLPAAQAADSTARTYPDPACSSRTANPENCVVQDGPPRAGTVPQKPLPETPPPTVPQTGASLTPVPPAPATPQTGTAFGGSKPAAAVTPQSGGALTQGKK